MIASLLVAGGLVLSFGLLAEEVIEGDTSGFDRAVLMVFRSADDPTNPVGPPWLEEMGHDVTSLGSFAGCIACFSEDVGRSEDRRGARRPAVCPFYHGGAVQPVRLADGTAFMPTGRIDCDTGAALIHAARSGLGAAYLLKCLAKEELQTGALVAVAPDIALPTLPLNVLHAFGRTVPARVKIFCDFIAVEARTLVGL